MDIILDWMDEIFWQWMDKEGKTPLILACMRRDLLHVAKALIEMGANVNAYRPGKKFILNPGPGFYRHVRINYLNKLGF